jgi:hypothetical protein
MCLLLALPLLRLLLQQLYIQRQVVRPINQSTILRCLWVQGIVLLVKRAGLAEEPLLKGKVQYNWPPRTNKSLINCFYILFCKTSYLNEEAYCTEPFPLISVPWLGLYISKQPCLLEGLRVYNYPGVRKWLAGIKPLTSWWALECSTIALPRYLYSEMGTARGLVQLTSSLRYLAL